MTLLFALLFAVILIVVLLRYRTPIGIAMLLAGFLIWSITDFVPEHLWSAFSTTLTQPRTWDLLWALYFVMCLEVLLRRSGTLQRMVDTLRASFASTRVVLAVMPAFLGLLPSLGGARFSCPIVDEATKGLSISAESKASINFWFRHVFEFASPIVPGILLGCSIAQIHIGDLILHLAWLCALAILVGWWVLIRPLRFEEPASNRDTQKPQNYLDVVLAIFPIVLNVVLMIGFDSPASISMGIVSIVLFLALLALHRPVSLLTMIKESADWKLLGNVFCILYFIQLLDASGVLKEIADTFLSSSLPVPVIISAIAFLIGMLTGMSQGHVAIVMPIVAAVAPGSVFLAGLAMVFGVAGQMITPTHVCLTISIDYFKANFGRTLLPIALTECLLLIPFIVWSTLFPG